MASSSVFAATTTKSATAPLVMYSFCPSSTQPSSRRRARVRIERTSLPASGSVIAMPVRAVPRRAGVR